MMSGDALTGRLQAPAAVLEEAGPPAPRSLEETGLSLGFVSDLALRTLAVGEASTGGQLAQKLGLPFTHVVSTVLEHLRGQHLVEVRGGGLGEHSYVYALVEKGRLRAKESMETTAYVGPAPVTLEQYVEVMRRQAAPARVKRHDVERHLSHLVLDPEVIDRLGPAINSRRVAFIYGAPGNGKTAMAQAVGRMQEGTLWTPYAITAHGAVIVLHQPHDHAAQALDVGAPAEAPRPGHLGSVDRRWVERPRPFVAAGGDLILDDLDLSFDAATKVHHAPHHLKANGGIFFIDDFGRQRASLQELLNRWVVPLETHVDFLTLQSGDKIAVPFETLILLATNIRPTDLMDEAFLRRIPYKIELGDPSEEAFRAIFRREAERLQLRSPEAALDHLIDRHYRAAGRPFRGCQPRDLLGQIVEMVAYEGSEPEVTPRLLDRACGIYFVHEPPDPQEGTGQGTMVLSLQPGQPSRNGFGFRLLD